MAKKQGMVLSTDNRGWAEVMVQDDSHCGSCQSGCGCALGTDRSKTATRVRNRAGAREGDRVDIQLDTGSMFKSIAALYLIPVAGLLAGALWGAELDAARAAGPAALSVLLGLAGLGLGFAATIFISRRISRNRKFSPIITRIIGVQETKAEFARNNP
jgi:sigma-E factor negative regulatory protein RseC